MNIYTKTGDHGTTKLMKLQNVSKTDDRIEFLGCADELNSFIGLVKTTEASETVRNELERIQRNLMKIMAGVADQYKAEHKMQEEEVVHLEQEIDRMEGSFEQNKEFILPGDNLMSAQLDITRTITRRAERVLIRVDKKYFADAGAKKYMNRLADYFYMLARYTDDCNEKNRNAKYIQKDVKAGLNQDALVSAVVDKLGLQRTRIDLGMAKKLIAMIEERAAKEGLNAVIAVCGPDGNPVAVHVMDNAYLASFDIALKKAYTSVAVKMSTKQLGELAQPGGTFYGIDKTDNGRILIIGGGVPLISGDHIIGGLGVSGGTSELDNAIAEYGALVLAELEG